VVGDVTYVIAGCLVVQQLSDDHSRFTFGSLYSRTSPLVWQ